MLQKRKLLGIAVAALSAFAALATSAQATNSFSIEPGGRISMPSQGKLSFIISGATLGCSLTLNGTLRHGGLFLLETALMGAITEVTINRGSCEGARFRAILIGGLNPTWWVQFGALVEARGTIGELFELPIAKTIAILNVGLELESFAGLVNCLWGGTFEAALLLNLVSHEERRNVFTSGLARVGARSSLTSRTGGSCPLSLPLAGVLSFTPQQTIWKNLP